jgi:outer membrane protein assembly factor BamB
MTIAKNRKTAAMIALFLMSAMAISFFALPTAKAPSTKETYAYIGAVPNPVGVNQQTLIGLGITDVIGPNASAGWTGLTVTVTRPDGSNETLGPFRTDSTGGTGTVYIPSMVGTYYLQTNFPQQDYLGITRLASTSEKLALVVQQEPVAFYPGVPLPTEYWTRPIDAQIREWYSIAGSWLTTPDNLFAPYNDGPESAHILWVKPLTLGGEVGGELGLVGSGPTSVGMETGDAYEGKWSNRLILMGRLYYTTGAYDRPREIHCVDLHTGEELWAKTFLDNQTIAFGQLFYWQSYNVQGTFAYLWVTVGTTWTAFDAFTGEWRATITDVPSGTNIFGPNGEVYRYSASLTGGYMTLWNMSALVSWEASWGSAFSLRQYNASSGTYRSLLSNGTLGAETTTGAADRAKRAWAWNITIPKGLRGSVRAVNLTDRVVGASINTTDVVVWAFSLEKGQEGMLLFNKDWKAPAAWAVGNQTIEWMTSSLRNDEEKVGVLFSKETYQNYGFSLETGDYLWGPTTPPQYYLDALEDTKAGARVIAYGKLYSASVGGIVYCYNVTTGKTLWTYEAVDPYTEILWANNWWMRPLFVTDGKIYVGHYEHSANQPLPRGGPFICLNATTGEVIWRANGLFRQTRWGGRAIIGDSIIATMDTYDQRVYAIGKGPSATTVSIQNDITTLGSNVMITGTVTDISPGTKEDALTLRFPNGVPAVSDESMSDWMLYVYKQFPRPANATGVEVTLDTVDPNGNFVHIGTVTSDADGMFKKAFTPEVPGEYTIIATFEGSESYWGSHAETAIYVGEAPPATAPPEYPQPIDYTLHFVFAIVVLLIAIAIVGLLILRKK